MSVAPILRFFKPLQSWLEQKNKENGDVPGWIHDDKSGVLSSLNSEG